MTEPRVTLALLLDAPERAIDLPAEEVPALLARLTSLQGVLLARLLARPIPEGEQKPDGSGDRLLTAGEAATVIGVSPRWLYRHANHLPFSRRFSRKVLRFSAKGLERWIAAKRA